MKSKKMLENELAKANIELENADYSYMQALSLFEKEVNDETKNKVCDCALKKEEAKRKVYELDLILKHVNLLVSVKEKIIGVGAIALTQEETKKAVEIVNKAIDRWLSN